MTTSEHYTLVGVLALATLIPGQPASGQSIYFPPSGDTWERVDPESVGWDAESLAAALDVAASRRSSGVVILLNGRIMAERYWQLEAPSPGYLNSSRGDDRWGHAIEDVESVQKSVTAVLVGIARERGMLRLDDPVAEHLGRGWAYGEPENEQAITIRHLLSMTSGLVSPPRGFQTEPGTVWDYNTRAYHNLMRVVETVTGQQRNAITRAWLTDKLGMESSSWMPRRTTAAGFGFFSTARDLARFGLMIQAGGRWGDQVVVEDGEYLKQMLSPSQSMNPAYGYLWWLNGQEFWVNSQAVRQDFRVDGQAARQDFREFAQAARVDGPYIPSAPADLVTAQGVFDRKLYVVPSLGLVVARLGDVGETDGMRFNDAFWQALMRAKR